MEDGSLKASNRVVKETTEQNLCFSLGIPVPVELVKKVMRIYRRLRRSVGGLVS